MRGNVLERQPSAASTNGRFKYIFLSCCSNINNLINRFHIGKGIEQYNVADQHPEVVQKMKQIMAKEHTTPKVNRFKMKALEREKKKQ
jgi:arylsulfatase